MVIDDGRRELVAEAPTPFVPGASGTIAVRVQTEVEGSAVGIESV
jgi:hypothetical protein